MLLGTGAAQLNHHPRTYAYVTKTNHGSPTIARARRVDERAGGSQSHPHASSRGGAPAHLHPPPPALLVALQGRIYVGVKPLLWKKISVLVDVRDKLRIGRS